MSNDICADKLKLRDKLENFREDESKNYKYPIFKYETINYLLKHLPRNLESLKNIKGLSESKAKKYGTKILTIINSYQIPDKKDNVMDPQLWIIIDLETTGLSWQEDDIIQLCVKYVMKNPDSQYQELSIYTQYVSTEKSISYTITQLTGISKNDLINAPNFKEIYLKIRNDIDEITFKYNIKKVFWLAHNGLNFDYLFLFLKSKDIERKINYQEWFVDTLDIVKNIDWNPPMENYKLNTIHKYLLGYEIENAHRADIDVVALYKIFLNHLIQKELYNFVYPTDYVMKKVLNPPQRKQKLNKFLIDKNIVEKIINLCQKDESVIIKHLNSLLQKYPNIQNSQQIVNFIQNYKINSK